MRSSYLVLIYVSLVMVKTPSAFFLPPDFSSSTTSTNAAAGAASRTGSANKEKIRRAHYDSRGSEKLEHCIKFKPLSSTRTTATEEINLDLEWKGTANKKEETVKNDDRPAVILFDYIHTPSIHASLSFLDPLREKYAHQPTFLQAVEEMAESLAPIFANKEKGEFYKRAFLVMTEPERSISFRVNWTDDQGRLQTNRGWRVEFSSVLGPYKGGLRFHPTVDEGVLKFLGFEQIFKNALTGLQMGGGKGGSDFDPKGKSDGEVRRFCEAYMTELSRYIHPQTDVPAGDIGVGGRELGFLYGQYKRLTKRSDGVLTGKPIILGGSECRIEATGYGVVYIAQLAVEKNGGTLQGARCAVSGSGNVAQYTAEKLIDIGAKVVSMSDSDGTLVFQNGMTMEDWNVIIDAKQVKRTRLSNVAADGLVNGVYHPKHSPWTIDDLKVEYAFPCATQNEIDGQSAELLIRNGVKGIIEGANLPTKIDAQRRIRESKILYIPGKAANAGGVATSGFEMAQNAQRLNWESDEVNAKLKATMKSIYNQIDSVTEGGECTLEQGANRAGFLIVAEAMKTLGWVW